MSYTLQAIVGHEVEMRKVAPSDLATIALKDGFALWPFVSAYQDDHAMPFLPLTDDGASDVPQSVVDVAALLSDCAYVEAEFFGGDGVQASAIYRNGMLVGSVSIGESVINDALRILGFKAQPPHDEFASIGLGRERNTDAWLNHQAGQVVPPNDSEAPSLNSKPTTHGSED